MTEWQCVKCSYIFRGEPDVCPDCHKSAGFYEMRRDASQHPPPSLEKLADQHGGFDRIPHEAWVGFYEARRRWQNFVALGGLHEGRRDRPWGFIDAKARSNDKFKSWPYSG